MGCAAPSSSTHMAAPSPVSPRIDVHQLDQHPPPFMKIVSPSSGSHLQHMVLLRQRPTSVCNAATRIGRARPTIRHACSMPTPPRNSQHLFGVVYHPCIISLSRGAGMTSVCHNDTICINDSFIQNSLRRTDVPRKAVEQSCDEFEGRLRFAVASAQCISVRMRPYT